VRLRPSLGHPKTGGGYLPGTEATRTCAKTGRGRGNCRHLRAEHPGPGGKGGGGAAGSMGDQERRRSWGLPHSRQHQVIASRGSALGFQAFRWLWLHRCPPCEQIHENAGHSAPSPAVCLFRRPAPSRLLDVGRWQKTRGRGEVP